MAVSCDSQVGLPTPKVGGTVSTPSPGSRGYSLLILCAGAASFLFVYPPLPLSLRSQSWMA